VKLRQLLAAVAGVVTLALGLTLGGFEELVADLVSTLGSDYFFLAALGGVALLGALPVVVSARSATLQQADTHDPETPVDRPPVGRDFDATVRSWRFRLPVVGGGVRESVRDRLRRAAVGALVRSRDCDRDRAERLVARGEWTDEREAAAFLAAEEYRSGNAVTAIDAAARFQTPTQYRAQAAARAVARLDGRGSQ
jgi:hypothetical protein